MANVTPEQLNREQRLLAFLLRFFSNVAMTPGCQSACKSLWRVFAIDPTSELVPKHASRSASTEIKKSTELQKVAQDSPEYSEFLGIRIFAGVFEEDRGTE